MSFLTFLAAPERDSVLSPAFIIDGDFLTDRKKILDWGSAFQ